MNPFALVNICCCSKIKVFPWTLYSYDFLIKEEAKKCFSFLQCIHQHISHFTFIKSVLFTKHNPGYNLRFRQEDWQPLAVRLTLWWRKYFVYPLLISIKSLLYSLVSQWIYFCLISIKNEMSAFQAVWCCFMVHTTPTHQGEGSIGGNPVGMEEQISVSHFH